MLSPTLRWYQEMEETRAHLAPTERTLAILQDLRDHAGLWAEISRHSSKGAGQVAAARWRKRWRGLADGPCFRARTIEKYPGQRNPIALLLAFKPTVEVADAPLSTE